MKNMLLFLLFTSFAGFSQHQFPAKWVGDYKGDLRIHTTDSVAKHIAMDLKIHPTEKDSVYSWTLVYTVKDIKDVRSYELRSINSKKGHYQIDEKNSILIDAYYKNGIFTSFFEVMQTYIIATYTLTEHGSILFEIISASTKPVQISGNTTRDKDSIPEVKSFTVNGRQTALLIKQ